MFYLIFETINSGKNRMIYLRRTADCFDATRDHAPLRKNAAATTLQCLRRFQIKGDAKKVVR